MYIVTDINFLNNVMILRYKRQKRRKLPTLPFSVFHVDYIKLSRNKHDCEIHLYPSFQSRPSCFLCETTRHDSKYRKINLSH